MSDNIVLEVKNIWKKHGHHVIVNNVSFSLQKGDILGFIGPNGAGKTTTIKLILGLQSLNGGSVKIDGFDLKKNFAKAISNVGGVIENPDMYMYMSGYENLKLSALLYNIDDSRIMEVAKIVGLEKRINDKVKKYSLGMRQRLGIAQAILHKPKVLILDEPMNGLDPEGIKDLKVLLQKLATEENLAILVSSHLLSELENFCNRICILVKGQLIKDLKIKELIELTDNEEYTLEVSRVNLETILYQFEILDNSHIKINTTKSGLSNILKTLLLNNVDIYELKKNVVSLEDIFLKTTKENYND